MSIEEIIRRAEALDKLREIGWAEEPEPEMPERAFDPLYDIHPGAELMFPSPDGIMYGTFLGYDGKVTNVRESYFASGMGPDEYVLPDFANRDRIVRLDSIIPVDGRRYNNPFQLSAVFR